MQGKKQYQEKLFLSFQLSQRVPETNFYRRLKKILDLQAAVNINDLRKKTSLHFERYKNHYSIRVDLKYRLEFDLVLSDNGQNIEKVIINEVEIIELSNHYGD